MNKNFNEAVESRRSIYAISKDVVLSNEEIQNVVNESVKYAPSAFNSQSARILLLLGSEHDKLWDITKEILRKIVPPEYFSDTEAKINAFGSGCGTVLFFEDQSTVEQLQEKFPLYKDSFPDFSLQSSGMLQYIIWTSLEAVGYGATLQHYNQLIDEKVKSHWGISDKWKLLAEMPFGKPVAAPDEKTFLPLEDRIKISK